MPEAIEAEPKLAGVILAGGASSRMGGNDKSLVLFRGRPLLAHALAALAPQVAEIAVSVHLASQALTPFGVAQLADPAPAGARQGPMAGIVASLAWAGTLPGVSWCVTVPVDCPLLPNDLAARLLASAAARSSAAAYLVTPAGEQPLAAIWSLSCAAPAARYLAGGGRSVRGFHRELGSTAMPGEAVWALNLNSPGDFTAAGGGT